MKIWIIKRGNLIRYQGVDENVNIPSYVIRISGKAFADCRYIRMVNIPRSVIRIESGAFAHCRSLTRIEIPSTVSWISTNLFTGCDKLSCVRLYSAVKYIESNAFSELPKNCRIIVDGDFLSEKQIENTVMNISDCLFSYLSGRLSVSEKTEKFLESKIRMQENFDECFLRIFKLNRSDLMQKLFDIEGVERNLTSRLLHHCIMKTESVEMRAVLMDYKHTNFSDDEDFLESDEPQTDLEYSILDSVKPYQAYRRMFWIDSGYTDTASPYKDILETARKNFQFQIQRNNSVTIPRVGLPLHRKIILKHENISAYFDRAGMIDRSEELYASDNKNPNVSTKKAF